MSQITLNSHSEDRLKRAIMISIGLHVAVVAALTLRAVIYPSEPLMLESAIRVDIVALPDKSVSKITAPAPPAEVKGPEPAKVPEPAPAPKPEAAPKVEIAKPAPPKPDAPTVNLEKSKKNQEAALKRLEALQRLERSMKNQQTASAPASASSENAEAGPSQVIKGNEVSRGSDLRGLARLEHQSYLRTIDKKVKNHWNLPPWLLTANLKMRIRLYVDSQGVVFKKQVIQASNQPLFDEKVIQAIEEASPLPEPPSSLVNLLAVDGVELEFHPQQ